MCFVFVFDLLLLMLLHSSGIVNPLMLLGGLTPLNPKRSVNNLLYATLERYELT